MNVEEADQLVAAARRARIQLDANMAAAVRDHYQTLEELKADANSKIDQTQFEALLSAVAGANEGNHKEQSESFTQLEASAKELQTKLAKLKEIYVDAPNQTQRVRHFVGEMLLPGLKRATIVLDEQNTWYHRARMFSEAIYAMVSQFQERVQHSTVLQSKIQQHVETNQGAFESIRSRFEQFPAAFERKMELNLEQMRSAQLDDAEVLQQRFQKQLPQIQSTVASGIFTQQQSDTDASNSEVLQRLQLGIENTLEQKVQEIARRRAQVCTELRERIAAQIAAFRERALGVIANQEEVISQFVQKNKPLTDSIAAQSDVKTLTSLVLAAEQQWLEELGRMKDKVNGGSYRTVQNEIEQLLTNQLGETVKTTASSVSRSFAQIQNANGSWDQNVTKKQQQLTAQIKELEKHFRQHLSECATLTNERLEILTSLISSKLSRANKEAASVQNLMPASEFLSALHQKLDKQDVEVAFSVKNQPAAPADTVSPRFQSLTLSPARPSPSKPSRLAVGNSLLVFSGSQQSVREDPQFNSLNYGYDEGSGRQERLNTRLQSQLKRSSRAFSDKRQWRLEMSPNERLNTLMQTYGSPGSKD